MSLNSGSRPDSTYEEVVSSSVQMAKRLGVWI